MGLWEDGFDHYGTGTSSNATANSRMLDGSYATVNHDGVVGQNYTQTTIVATGTHSFYFGRNGGLHVFEGLRNVLPTPITKLGMTARFYFPSLPGQTYSNYICHF